jgi:hypothetical protein
VTNEQRQARAIQRASKQKAHVRALRGRPGFYQVKSATDPRERHTLAVQAGAIVCSCAAAANGVPCWHVEKLRSCLIREAARAAAKQTALAIAS